jgi:hypothetical protein
MRKFGLRGRQMERAKRSLCAIAVCATAVVGVGASAAFAGEITGSGKPTGNRPDFVTPLHASSACAYSGTTMTRAPLWTAAGLTAPAVSRSPTGKTSSWV